MLARLAAKLKHMRLRDIEEVVVIGLSETEVELQVMTCEDEECVVVRCAIDMYARPSGTEPCPGGAPAETSRGAARGRGRGHSAETSRGGARGRRRGHSAETRRGAAAAADAGRRVAAASRTRSVGRPPPVRRRETHRYPPCGDADDDSYEECVLGQLTRIDESMGDWEEEEGPGADDTGKRRARFLTFDK